MDGITGSPTLGGVVLATLSAAGYAVFKVCDILHARYINIHNCIIFRHGNIKIWHDKLYSQVMFRKVMGDPPVAQIAFTFTILGFINAALCWPISLCLYLTGAEVMPWESLSWTILFTASVLMLGKCCGRTYEYEVRQRWIHTILRVFLAVFHILMQFSVAVTYTMFVTLGLITSVPVSAGKFSVALNFELVIMPDLTYAPDNIT